MRKYLLVCRNALKDHLLWKAIDIPHLIETLDLYSLQDLVDTHSGELPSKLHAVSHVLLQHIKEQCDVCKGRAHICEVCSNEEVLYPFDAAAMVCDRCGAVLHRSCFSRKKNSCPKCTRLEVRKEQEDAMVRDCDDD